MYVRTNKRTQTVRDLKSFPTSPPKRRPFKPCAGGASVLPVVFRRPRPPLRSLHPLRPREHFTQSIFFFSLAFLCFFLFPLLPSLPLSFSLPLVSGGPVNTKSVAASRPRRSFCHLSFSQSGQSTRGRAAPDLEKEPITEYGAQQPAKEMDD